MDHEEEGARKFPVKFPIGEKPDEYVRCPYFPEHELRRSRMPYHIMKCQKNPNAPNLLACPHNYMHRIRPEDCKEHLETCEDRPNKIIPLKPPSYAKTEKQTNSRAGPSSAVGLNINDEPIPPETGETSWW